MTQTARAFDAASSGEFDLAASDAPSVGQLLRAYRQRLAMTMEELSAASGVSARTISDLELGLTRRPREHTLAAIAAVLSLDAKAQVRLISVGLAGHGLPPVGETEAMPRSVPDFVGRSAALAWLTDVVGASGSRTALICGPPGVGKTALAVQGAALLADRFAHGTLFVDMRGLDPVPLPADQAAARLLRAFGVTARLVPIARTARLEAYQAAVAERNTLLVLDNVVDEEQVRPLLPARGDSRVWLTSRQQLGGLPPVDRRELPPLQTADAVALLELILGDSRPAQALAGVDELARLCGNLPSALRVAANRLLSRPSWTVGRMVERLKRDG
jgi:transcriptional regulator with XRE-family HTH domain